MSFLTFSICPRYIDVTTGLLGSAGSRPPHKRANPRPIEISQWDQIPGGPNPLFGSENRHLQASMPNDWDFPVTEYQYSDAGTETCAGYPGSLGYEAIDAATWASWDIDCEFPVS